MMLTVPRRVVGAAAPRFAVVGEAAGSQDYYLGPETPVEAFIRVRPEQARFKDGRRAVRLEVSHLASAAPVVVRSGQRPTLHRGTLNPGYNLATLAVDGQAASLPITVEVAGRVASDTTVTLPPVRAWEIHLLPHSHVDIGYSDPQPEVERKQWKNLRDAVALAAATASNPPDSRFRWNVEGLWSVESYLKQASADERRQFIEAVRQGSIGLQSNYTNILTGLATPEELGRWTDAARRLSAEYGLPVGKSAMHTDIPGLSWTVVSALARGGVRYFSSGPNYMPSLPDRGDRIGQTLHELGDRPFWWLSPSGQERLLMWVAGRGYSMFHGMNTGSMETGGRQTLLDYMLELAGKDYPYDMVQVRYTIGGDNGPTDPKLPGFVKTWNETFDVAAPGDRHGRRAVRGVRAAVRREAAGAARRHDAVLGGRRGVDRRRGGDGAGCRPAPAAGRDAVGDAKQVGIPVAGLQRRVAPGPAVARAHVGRRRQHQPAGPQGRRRSVALQARLRRRSRTSSHGRCWTRPRRRQARPSKWSIRCRGRVTPSCSFQPPRRRGATG